MPELDALRGIACLTIVIYHAKSSAVPFGWAAVDLFFVLSGYLITAIVIRHEGAPHVLRNFYIRRALRIWPIYYLTLLVVVVVGPRLPIPVIWEGLPYYLTFTQNVPSYWSGRIPPFSPYVAHLWTLANEEQFYIVWPFLVCLAGGRRVVSLALALTVLSVAARGYGLHTWLLLARADGFALGGLLAALLANRARVAERLATFRWGFALTTAAALAFLAVVVARGDLPTFGRPREGSAFSVLALNLAFFGIVGLTILHAGRRSLAWLRARWLVRVGMISYGLYMYHYLCLMLGGDVLRVLRGGRGRSPLIDVALLALTYLLASLSWAWIERPLLGLKQRFPYGKLRVARGRSYAASKAPLTMEGQ